MRGLWERLASGRVGSFEGAQDFVGLEVCEEFGDGGGLAGEVVVRGEFGEGLEDEAPQVGAWMRQGQERGGTCEIIPGDEVEVEGAGFVEDDLWPSTGFAFEFLEGGEQGFGCLAGQGPQFSHGIDETRGTGRAVHRRGGPEGGPTHRGAGKRCKADEGVAQDRRGVPEVGAQGDEDSTGGHGRNGCGRRGYLSPRTSCMS